MSIGLFQSIRNYRVKQVKFLFSSGLPVSVCNQSGQSVLVAALEIEDEVRRRRMFNYLRSQGADCGACDPSTGRSIFAWACFLDRTAEAKLVLVDQGGNIDFHEKDNSGRTPAHYTAVNGNAVILQAIVDYMKNYGISVDIRDSDGFTPYILAKRMGKRDCVEILEKGGASRQQFDDKNFRSVDDWEWIGEREKSFFVHRSHDRKVGMYKMLGRLPALKAANFHADDIKITESKVDRSFLSSKELKPPEIKSKQMFKQNTWLDFEKSKLKRLTRSLPNFHLAPIGEIPDEKDVSPDRQSKDAKSTYSSESVTVSSTSSSSSPTANSHRQDLTYSGSPVSFNVKKDTRHRDNLADIMRVLEDQCSHAYRPVVRKKVLPPTSPAKGGKLAPFGSAKDQRRRRMSSKMENHVFAKKMARKLSSSRDNHNAGSVRAPSSTISVITEES